MSTKNNFQALSIRNARTLTIKKPIQGVSPTSTSYQVLPSNYIHVHFWLFHLASGSFFPDSQSATKPPQFPLVRPSFLPVLGFDSVQDLCLLKFHPRVRSRPPPRGVVFFWVFIQWRWTCVPMVFKNLKARSQHTSYVWWIQKVMPFELLIVLATHILYPYFILFFYTWASLEPKTWQSIGFTLPQKTHKFHAVLLMVQ